MACAQDRVAASRSGIEFAIAAMVVRLHFFLGIGRCAFHFLATALYILSEPAHRIAGGECETECQQASPLHQRFHGVS
jgi:hypothetical protein